MRAAARETELRRLRAALARGDRGALHALLEKFAHPSDLADLLEELEEPQRARVLAVLAEDPARAAEALAEMEPEEHPEDALATLSPERLAAVVAELDDDDAADMIAPAIA